MRWQKFLTRETLAPERPTPRRAIEAREAAARNAVVERLENRSLLSGGPDGGWGAEHAAAAASHAAQPVVALTVSFARADMPTGTSAPRFAVARGGSQPDAGPTLVLARADGRAAGSAPAAAGRLAARRVQAGAHLRQPSVDAGAEDGSMPVAGVRGAARAAQVDGAAVARPAGRPPLVKLDEPPERRPAPRALVVEDDPVSRRALANLLRTHGWDVTTAATAAEGVRQLAAVRPDAVLLDLMLPDGDGEQVLIRARAAGHPARVTVMTGTADPARLGRLAALGADGLMIKPIRVEDVLSRLTATVTASAGPVSAAQSGA
jgi:CheY-like chemotaxis protein